MVFGCQELFQYIWKYRWAAAWRHMTVIGPCNDLSGCLDITGSGRVRTALNEDALAKRLNLAVVGHIGPAPRGDKMSLPHALSTLAALG